MRESTAVQILSLLIWVQDRNPRSKAIHMTPKGMRSQFFVGNDQRQTAVLVRQRFKRCRAEFPAPKLVLDPNALNENAVEQRRDGEFHFADTQASICANRRADDGGRRSRVDVAKCGKRVQINARQVRNGPGSAILKLLSAAPPEPVGFVNGAGKRLITRTHVFSSPLHGGFTCPPVSPGGQAFLFICPVDRKGAWSHGHVITH